MERLNINDFNTRTGVRISAQRIADIKFRAIRKFGSLQRFYKILATKDFCAETIKNLMKPSSNTLIPLELLKNISEVCQISNIELQTNISSYGLIRGSTFVVSPILPVRITPIFDMLFAHHIADGFVTKPGRNRLPYFGYKQFDTLYRLLYFEKLQEVFGDINFDYDEALKTMQIYCPAVLSHFFFKAYDVDCRHFLSEKAYLPDKLLKKPKEHLLAVLIAFLIDEGHIDGSCMLIRLKNRHLVNQLHSICSQLGYKATVRTEPQDYSVLYILARGMEKFWQDYLSFIQKYPVADLGWKSIRINNQMRWRERRIKFVPGNQQEIRTLLENEQLTINELAARLKMTRQGIRYHVNALLNEQKVKRTGLAKYASFRYAAIP